MVDLQDLKERAKELLEQEEVKCVLGYRPGTAGLMAEPAFITKADDVENLIWDPTCVHNLALYLTEEKKNMRTQKAPDNRPMAIVAKGCDSRAIVVLLQESYITRESVYIIGVSCAGTGVVDKIKLAKHLDGKRAQKLEFSGADFLVTTDKGEVKVPAKEVLADRCLECRNPYPDEHDVVLGEKVEQEPREPFATLNACESVSNEDRWTFWEHHFSRCLRCYACRSICPMCHCDECVVDSISLMVTPATTAEQKSNRIKWIERSNSTSENIGYHLVRAIHLVGRCIDCGECERVCPVDIPLRLLNKKLEKEAFEMFDYEPGLDPQQPSLVSSFRDEDPDDFIR